jgi:hypothetical protein
LHDDLDVALWNIGAPGDDVQGAVRDGVIRRTSAFFQPDLDFFGHGAHAFMALTACSALTFWA